MNPQQPCPSPPSPCSALALISLVPYHRYSARTQDCHSKGEVGSAELLPCLTPYKHKVGRTHCSWGLGITSQQPAGTRRCRGRGGSGAIETCWGKSEGGSGGSFYCRAKLENGRLLPRATSHPHQILSLHYSAPGLAVHLTMSRLGTAGQPSLPPTPQSCPGPCSPSPWITSPHCMVFWVLFSLPGGFLPLLSPATNFLPMLCK